MTHQDRRPSREAVAKFIDPRGWAERAEHLAAGNISSAEMCVMESLDKADAILALPSEASTAPGQAHDESVQQRIRTAIYKAVQQLEGSEDLLSVLGSWGDTLDDSDIANLLEDLSSTGRIIHETH